MAENCLSLSGSKTCPSFSDASISRNENLIESYPFLQYVDDVESFDQELEDYIHRGYVQMKYQDVLGCGGIKLSNTSSLYARYTKSVLCNGIVANSKEPCDLSDDTATLCADTCALSAISEQEIATNPELCESPKAGFMDAIRSDYTVCGLPEKSLTDSCVSGKDNEPTGCGYGPNLIGLCGYCGSNSPNSTDSCCKDSDVASKCDGVTVPTTTTTLPPLFPTDTDTPDKEDDGGLSGGQIAGIVVGSILGFALIVALIALLLIYRRRNRNHQQENILNQQNPPSRGMSAIPTTSTKKQGYEVLPGGRVARMSALQGPSDPSSPPRGEDSGTAAFAGASKFHESSDSEGYGGSPAGLSRRGPPTASRRNGSLSSGSALAGGDPDTSPRSGAQYSSPMGSGQSEQLDSFKDYYSQDDIHPNDKVSVLWAYQPRAGDEFELDRGDMLKVVGIWDDGWATGVRINERAEDYDNSHKVQRDSGVSNGSERRDSSPHPSGEIKAFPLVCVCLPEHWQKTIEGDINVEGAVSPV